MDDYVGIPEDLRCKRSDGKQWRCSALSMPDKTVCEKHYIQAKRRAANSALRASERKARRKSMDDGDIYLESRSKEVERSRSVSPMNNVGGAEWASRGRYKEKVSRSQGQGLYSREMARGVSAHGGFGRPTQDVEQDADYMEEDQIRSGYKTPPFGREAMNYGSGPADYSGKTSGSSDEVEGLTCHHCQRNDLASVVWCISCDSRGYCSNCISRWYADIPVEDIRQVCPACRGICNCRICLQADNLVKAKIHEMPAIDKLRYLHSLLKFILPILKNIYRDQCFEIGVETRAYGPKSDIPRAKIDADEQMCCDLCKVPILDYHRHCTKCSYDLCLNCCRDIRRASSVTLPTDGWSSDRSKDVAAETACPESSGKTETDECSINFAHQFPKWKANRDGTIPCCPVEAGGCGSSELVLRRLFKINWVAKLVKSAEEMVNGCITRDPDTLPGCPCQNNIVSESNGSSAFTCRQCSNRESSIDNFLYFPVAQDIKLNGINHFHQHWSRGEPVVVRHTFECPLASSWDPTIIWRGIQEMIDKKTDDSIKVKAFSCNDQSEVELQLGQFIKGYSECTCEDGSQAMLRIKDWPTPSVVEEFILCQRPEFLVNFPLIEFLHYKWGILNLVAKLPHDTMQNEIGPRLVISYGTHKELSKGAPVANLQVNMGDMVSLLMHTPEAALMGSESNRNFNKFKPENPPEDDYLTYSNMPFNGITRQPALESQEHHKENEFSLGLKATEDNPMDFHEFNSNGSSGHEKRDSCCSDSSERTCPGVVWDVFRRQDIPKLNEFLKTHWKHLTNTSQSTDSVLPVYDQAVYLSKDKKQMLKEEFRIEPWSFVQHVGEAVFIPSGCAFQLRYLQSSVQLVLNFLSPESLRVSSRMADEIRCLPNNHEAKIKMLEVGKMSLYAASSAVKEIQKITLDPKFSSDIKFENQNLTALVSENLEKVIKRRRRPICS
ncbi:E3 ubiquitin-protein ligase JMJ24 [Curcuma longa]|uniref:E3 ubiquitin-protein ligase JMJ24 n=1 Tax=Curcuma longa TaxID=136217 RepID=UPI003D9F5AE4